MTDMELLQALKDAGARITPQRRMLVDVLLVAGESHLTADDICQSVRFTYADMGLDTVYRNLKLLVKLNLVTELKLPGRLTSYSLSRQPRGRGPA